MAEQIGSAYVAVGADVSAFEAGMAQVQADLAKVAAAADGAAGRYVDAQGRMRQANGQFVSAATLAAEAARNVGGSLGTLADTANRTGQSINQGLVSSFGAFDRAVKPLDAGIGRLGESLKSAGAGLTTYVTLPLGLLAGAALSSYGKIDGLTRGLNALASQDVAKQGATGVEAIGLAADATQARLKELQEIAKAPGIGFEQAVQGDIRLRAVGISAEQSAKILREFANAIALTGGGAGELSSVTVQLGQLSAKGKVLAQDLRPIIEAAPAVSQALQKLYGTVDSETISKSLEKQGKSSSDFIAILTDELAQIPRVAGGFSNAIENFTQSGQQDIARFGESINQAFNLEGLLGKVGGAITKLTDYFSSLSPATQRFALGAAVVAAAAGPIVFGLGAIVAAIPSVVAGLEVLGLASTAALGPLGIAVAAVAAGAALIVAHWDELTAYFSGEGGRVFSDLAESVSNASAEISSAFGSIQAEGDGSFGGLISATGVLKSLFQEVVVGLESIANIAGGTIGAVTRLLSGDLAGAAQQAERALYGLLEPLANLLGFTKQRSATISEFFGVIGAGAQAAQESIEGLLGGNISGATSTIGILEALKQKLKEVKEARDKETNVAAITADNALIKSLQAQIDKLEGVDKTGKKAADAIKKLREELARLTAVDGLLGDTPSQIEVLERRVTTLTAGFKNLVDAGVSTSSRAFRGFIIDLVNTSQALDKLRGNGAALDLKPANIKSLIPATIGDTLPQDVARLLGDYARSPYVLPVPIRLQLIEGSDFKRVVDDAMLGLSQSLLLASNNLAVFGGGFDVAGEKAAAFKATIQDLLASGISPMSPVIQQLAADYKEAQAQSNNLNILTSSLKDGFSSLGTSIGESLASGTSVINAVLASLIDALADYAQKKGALLIADGTADLFTPGLQGIGALKIAGGIGLLAAAGAAHAGASALKSSGGGGASIAKPASNYNSSTGASGNTPTIKVIAEFKLRGQDLVAIGRTNDYRVQRTG